MGIERRATGSAPTQYRPRRPSARVHYRCVQQHLEAWLAQWRDGHHDEWSVPEHVEREFRRYLECGILAHGFARARCGDCGHDLPVAFTCKGRGVCPSCNSRRMVATAAHLTDHVLPPLPLRQWVLAVPGRVTATPTPSRHPSTPSINASLGNPDRRPPAAHDAGSARAGPRQARDPHLLRLARHPHPERP